MPPSVNVAAFVFGVIFVLAALIGQEIEIVAVKLPALPRVTRLIIGVAGIILVYIGLFDPFGEPVGTSTAFSTTNVLPGPTSLPSIAPTLEPSPTPMPSATPLPTVAPTPEPPRTIDDVLRAANVTIRFYDCGDGFPPREQRSYTDRFDQVSARYICWELTLEHLPVQQRLDFVVHAIYYRPDGSVMSEQALETYREPEWDSSWHTNGWGWAEPGNWPSGRYTVALFVNGVEITRSSFTVV